MSKKKVLHLIQSLDSGGCENMLLRTLPLVSDCQHILVTLKEPGELAPKFEEAGIEVTSTHCAGFLNIAGILRLRKLVRVTKPNVIITYLFHADMLGRLGLFGTTQDPIIPFLRTTYNHPRYAIARLFEWLTKPLVRCYLANSEAVKDFYVRHIGVAAEAITVIPNGIDVESFDQIEADPKLREGLGMRPDDFVIICVANLHPNKGHCNLLEAFESLRPEFPQAKLLLVGDGEERKNLERQVESYHSKNSIFFLGKRDDVPKLLKVSDLFVLPTLFEGQSNAILEAMAAGVPVITTAIPENQALIMHGEMGFLVPVEDSRALATAIRQALTETGSLQAMASRAEQRIRDRYRLASVAEQWNRFLHSL